MFLSKKDQNIENHLRENLTTRESFNMSNLTTYNGVLLGYSTSLDTLLDIRLRVAVFILSVIVMTFNSICFIALCRTRHTPRSARFLSLALLIFDNLASATFAIRRFVPVARYNLGFQLTALGFIYLSYVAIALMSVERLVVFQWPNFYLRRVTLGLSRKIAITIWTSYFTLWTFECTRCYIMVDLANIETLMCFEYLIARYVIATHLCATLLSCICLMRISLIIVKQTSKTSGKRKTIQTYKSTVIVLLCVLNTILNTACGFILVYTVKNNYDRRATTDIQTVINGFLDTCVYVLWYKECRLELMKMFTRWFPSLNKNVEDMRISIFEIMTYRTDSQT